ncbi:MAG TPA: hypothetical protein VF739_17065 [Ktedonobacterales bacterium]
MGFAPAYRTPSEIEQRHVADVETPPAGYTSRAMLRFGGLAMDMTTGSAWWRSEKLVLSTDERQLLGALLRRGGQILSAERLATTLGTTVEYIEQRIPTLKITLRAAGVTCLPHRATGLGYVLWRG